MIARTRALDWLRTRRDRTLAEGAGVEPAVAGNALGWLERSDAMSRVGEALAVLPGPQRESVVLAFYDGLKHTEIARHQGVSLGTAKSRIRLGLSKLRELLDEAAEEPCR